MTLSDSVINRLVLHDFNRNDLSNNVGGVSGAWTARADITAGTVDLALVSREHRGELGNALHITYALDPHNSSTTGFRMGLNGLDGLTMIISSSGSKGIRARDMHDHSRLRFKDPSTNARRLTSVEVTW